LAVTPALGGENAMLFERVPATTGMPILAQAAPANDPTGADRQGDVLTLEQAITLALNKNRQVQN
jgi:hypothetical protein